MRLEKDILKKLKIAVRNSRFLAFTISTAHLGSVSTA
jgi:hypothetical protein